MGKSSYEQGKKLSWTYRKKAKSGKIKRSESDGNDINENNKNARLIVRNLSFKVTEEDIKKFYQPFGEIKEINLLRHPDGRLVGCGFIQFKRVEDASKAIFNTNKKEFFGRIINSDWAISKSKFCKKLEERLVEDQGTDKDEGHLSEDIHEENKESNNVLRKEKDILKKQKRRKLQKMKKQKKRARIVIRNLSFQTTEDNLKEHFSQYGEIEEVDIIKKSDGKQTGCAFIQFSFVQSAAKAIHYANTQTLLDRTIIVDWAVPKSKFSKNDTDENDVKPDVKFESVDKDNAQKTSVKVPTSNKDKASDSASDIELDSNEVTVEDIKMENVSDEERKETKYEMEDTDNEDENANDSNNDDDDENDDDNTIEQSTREEESDEEDGSSNHRRQISNDVSEGKTVFLKNVPFSIKNDELKKYMEQFGPVYYALVCIDRLTEYSKGTAFVKFRNIADAEKCLLAGTEFRLRDQIIEVHRALHKNEVENKKSLKEQRIKDSRNLYLIKEGVVLAKSSAAAEVSVSDMAKRLKLEQWKSQMLRNLNMFVSRVRLVVHNLPPDLDDAKLRQLFKNHSGPKAVIKEARVMRDLKNVDLTGKGKSKEYGFVTFTNHEDALKALRSINNNPNIFSKHRRPIAGFSIENRVIVNAKERRIQKSREHNSSWPESKGKRKSENIQKEVPTKRIKNRKSDDSNEESYVGVSGRLGQDKLRSNFNLKSQADLHLRTMRKEKKLSKAIRQLEITKKEKAKKKQDNMLTKQTTKFDADDSNFNELVSNYRKKLKAIDLKKSKWYECITNH